MGKSDLRILSVPNGESGFHPARRGGHGQHLVGADGEHRGAASAGDMAKGMGEEGLAHADRADDRDVAMGVEKAQRREPERVRVDDNRLRVYPESGP